MSSSLGLAAGHYLRNTTRSRSCLLLLMISSIAAAAEPVAIGSRRELFVDRLLIGELKGTALKLHTPQLMPPVSPPRPNGHYATVLNVDDKFQFYYREDLDPKVTWKTHGLEKYHEGEVTLYAQSKDAVHWELPRLGLYELEPFPEGNVVLAHEFLVNHNFTPFIDTRPGVVPDQRYKALGGLAYQPHQAAVTEKRGPGGLKAFVSMNAPLTGGEFITSLLTFTGANLEINYSTSAAGVIRVELQDAQGNPLPGLALEDCEPIWGDHIARVVKWSSGGDLRAHAGTPVRLRFVMEDADLFSLKFNP